MTECTKETNLNGNVFCQLGYTCHFNTIHGDVLLLAFLYNSGGKLSFWTFLIVLALNYIMLGAGYLGETGVIQVKEHWAKV